MNANHTNSIEALESRIAPASLLTVAYDAGSGVLTLTDDVANAATGLDADNVVSILKTGPNSYRIADAGGTDIGSVGVSFLDIGKVTSLTINGDEGSDRYFITGLNGLKSFTFNGGAGDDPLTATDMVVKGGATINFGPDGGTANFDGSLTTISGDLNVNYGDGGGSVTFGAISTAIKGAVLLTGGLGDDNFSLSGAGNTSSIGKGITLNGGVGSDSVSINSAISAVIGKGATGNAIEFNGGAGNNSLTSTAAGTVSLKGSVLFNGGLDADDVAFQSSTLNIDGELNVNGGAGLDTVTISGSKVTVKKAVTLDLADGGSTVAISANLVTLGKTLTVKGTTGGDDLSIGVNRFSAGGAVSFEGGSGNDSFMLDAANVLIKGTLTITGGADADTATLRADGLVKGDLTLDLGASSDGVQDITLAGRSGLVGNLKLGGKLTVTSSADDGGVGYTDSFTSADVTVSKDVLINLGSADSTVTMDNFSTKGLFTLNTGLGNDEVLFERGSLFGPSSLSGIVTINLGDGDDIINIGQASPPAGTSSYVKFFANLNVDGGIGSDTRNNFGLSTINVFSGSATATATNFEVVI